jgi:hypothetical protein
LYRIIVRRKDLLNCVFSSVIPPQTFPFPRNEDVIMRDEIFSKLNRLLPTIPDYQTAVLWGLGGSGYEPLLEQGHHVD